MIGMTDPGGSDGATPTIQDLARTLFDLASPEPGWALDEASYDAETGDLLEPERGMALVYRAPGGHAQVRLLVSSRRVKLVARTHHRSGAWMEMEGRLVLGLGRTPTLAGQRFGSVDELAAELLLLARRWATETLFLPQASAAPQASVTPRRRPEARVRARKSIRTARAS